MAEKSTSMGAVGPELCSRSRFLLHSRRSNPYHVCRSKPIDGRTSTNIILNADTPYSKKLCGPKNLSGCLYSCRDQTQAATTTVPLIRLTHGNTYPEFFCSIVSPASTSIWIEPLNTLVAQVPHMPRRQPYGI